MHYMKWIYPRRLRNQMILMAILMVIVPTLTIGYIVETEGRSAVLSEKEKKLSAVVNLLNQALGNRYDLYIDLPREERIRALNAELAPITENITHAFPGIGAGYYNKTLDAISPTRLQRYIRIMWALPLPQITLVAKSCVQIPLWFIQAGRCAAIF